ncbi:hypothetical protein GNX71_08455 [Variovorax sp. RKNM96]|uniref:hypothetical protein n=1 Tax=Variovorax sp. RKNM96 TaxID=2681552 RepID=UPI00198265DD|nr:hypothetical protein [Variovorax sp. RKNM96]QSI29611.1 hypothetical protein GNX71_08455 [Variovorax sp. RKNM96]
MASCTRCHTAQQSGFQGHHIEAEKARCTRFGGLFFALLHPVRTAMSGDNTIHWPGKVISGLRYISPMEKASDIGKPTVPIDLIGPEHWGRSRRGNGRVTKVLCVIVGGLAAAGVIAYRFFGFGR